MKRLIITLGFMLISVCIFAQYYVLPNSTVTLTKYNDSFQILSCSTMYDLSIDNKNNFKGFSEVHSKIGSYVLQYNLPKIEIKHVLAGNTMEDVWGFAFHVNGDECNYWELESEHGHWHDKVMLKSLLLWVEDNYNRMEGRK